METQQKMIAGQKDVKQKLIEPIHLNKYVGYVSTHLLVTLDRVEARLKSLNFNNDTKYVNKHKFKLVIYR